MIKLEFLRIVVNWVMVYIEIGVWPKKHNKTTHYSLELSRSSILSNLPEFHKLVNMYQMFYIIWTHSTNLF